MHGNTTSKALRQRFPLLLPLLASMCIAAGIGLLWDRSMRSPSDAPEKALALSSDPIVRAQAITQLATSLRNGLLMLQKEAREGQGKAKQDANTYLRRLREQLAEDAEPRPTTPR